MKSLLAFESAYRHTYLSAAGIADVVELAAASLTPPAPIITTTDVTATSVSTIISNNRSRLIYLAFSPLMGQLAFIDASEMNDTFGNGFDAVRAFMHGGVRHLMRDPNSLLNLSAGQLFDVSLSAFKQTLLPTLTNRDTVVILLAGELEGASVPHSSSSSVHTSVIIHSTFILHSLLVSSFIAHSFPVSLSLYVNDFLFQTTCVIL